MVITWEDALAERYDRGKTDGRTEGKTEGETEGETKGRTKEARNAIVLLARHRHGELPDGFEEKLEAIHSLRRLHQVLEQVFDGVSLEELDLTP